MKPKCTKFEPKNIVNNLSCEYGKQRLGETGCPLEEEQKKIANEGKCNNTTMRICVRSYTTKFYRTLEILKRGIDL